MDLGTTITGVGILLLIIIPFIIMIVNHNKREKKSLQKLFSLAEQYNGKITRHDQWNNSLIGVDDTINRLFFVRKINEIEISEQVDLAEIQACRVVNNSRSVSNKDGSNMATDQVALLLTYYDKRMKERALEFYNVDHDGFLLKGEVQLAEKWSSIIKDTILVNTK